MTNSQNTQQPMTINTFRTINTSRTIRRYTAKPVLGHTARRNIGRTALVLIWCLYAALFASAAHAAKASIYTSYLNNTAVGGYDVVSYFKGDSKPIKGKKKFKASHQGANWLFANQENLDAFTDNPEKYQPQYGGYCAFAVAAGDTVKGDPLQYHIVDGKLYLNYNAKFNKIWFADKESFIEKANGQWPSLLE